MSSDYPKVDTDLTQKVIGCAIEVHRELAPGLLETVYETCMVMALTDAGIKCEKQKQIPIFFKGAKLDKTYCLDLLIEDELIVELKAVDKLLSIHEAQILTYMKLTQKSLGLLINFNETLLKNGLKRMRLFSDKTSSVNSVSSVPLWLNSDLATGERV